VFFDSFFSDTTIKVRKGLVTVKGKHAPSVSAICETMEALGIERATITIAGKRITCKGDAVPHIQRIRNVLTIDLRL